MKKSRSIITRDFNELTSQTHNIYKSTVLISKRANQINSNLKNDINRKLEDFITVQDDLKEVFENQEQIKISKYYEKLPKPINQATEECIKNELKILEKSL